MRPYKLWIILPDIHTPHEDKKALAAVESYIADESWDGWVCLGDLVDNDAISAFTNSKPRKLVNAPTVQEQFDYTNAFLDRHLALVRKKNPAAECVLIEGNHEERTERYCDIRPELEGLVNIERALMLKTRKVRYVRQWSKGELFTLGKLHVAHGASASKNHASINVRDYGCNLIVGHTHDIQTHSIKLRGKGKTISCQSIGCLCDLNQSYMRGRPNNWAHAFAVVYLMPNGFFQTCVVPIFDGRFVGPTTGKLYQG